jgi:hypothetical protein
MGTRNRTTCIEKPLECVCVELHIFEVDLLRCVVDIPGKSRRCNIHLQRYIFISFLQTRLCNVKEEEWPTLFQMLKFQIYTITLQAAFSYSTIFQKNIILALWPG